VSDHQEAASALQSRAAPPDPARAWETLFWTVFNRSRNPMAIIGRDRRYVDINPCHSQVFGRPRDQIVGTVVDDYLPPEELATVDAEYRQFSRNGEFTGERAYIKADGTVVRVEYAVCTESVTGHDLALFVSSVAEDEEEEKGEPVAGIRHGEALSPREREVVHHVALGMTSREIAEELTVSTETVRTHIRNALAKTGTRTRAQLVAQVMGTGSLAGD
jgi:PAS domain S-box-containing protein